MFTKEQFWVEVGGMGGGKNPFAGFQEFTFWQRVFFLGSFEIYDVFQTQGIFGEGVIVFF